MKVKIATLGFVLKSPKFEKELLVSNLIQKGFEKKYFKMGLMKAYRKDGTEIPTKGPSNEFIDKYQLEGKLFKIAFTGDDILVHHKFGQTTSEITYDLQEYSNELNSFLKNLMGFLTFEKTEFELILILTAKSSKNAEETLTNWANKLHVGNPAYTKNYMPDRIAYPGIVNDRCTTKNIMVRNREYVIELRFASNNWEDILGDFSDSEKIGTNIILEIENEN